MKISIVTPSFNSALYIRESIQSVISQRGDFLVEYFVVDNCSTDETKEIVEGFQRQLANSHFQLGCNGIELHFVSEKDSGMYDAINKGFSRATGDVFAWLNADDIYLPGAFDIIHKTFDKYPEIYWLKGITSYINTNSTVYAAGECFLYRQDWIRRGFYGTSMTFIQQDSVFWRANLWHKSGGANSSMALAGDYFLWKTFAELTPLYSLNAYVSCFRQVAGQKSGDMTAYWEEIGYGVTRARVFFGKVRRHIFYLLESLPSFLRKIFYCLAFGRFKHHLVILEGNITPSLREGEYFALRRFL